MAKCNQIIEIKRIIVTVSIVTIINFVGIWMYGNSSNSNTLIIFSNVNNMIQKNINTNSTNKDPNSTHIISIKHKEVKITHNINHTCFTMHLSYINDLNRFNRYNYYNKSLNILFYLYNELPIKIIRDFWTIFEQERFEYLKYHQNRVYNIADADVIIFPIYLNWDVVMHYPCYDNPQYSYIEPSIYNLTDIKWKYIYQNKQNYTKSKWKLHHNISKVKKNLNENIQKLNKYICNVIQNLSKQYSNLYYFLLGIRSHKIFKCVHDTFLNKIIISLIGINPAYRNNIDISYPPPFTSGLMRDNQQIIDSNSLDPCRKRKYFVSFYGELRSHNVRQWMLKYNNFTLKQLIINKRSRSNITYDDIMINSDYIFCPRGTRGYTFRFREALESGNIIIMIADNYTLPFNDEINWNKYIQQNAIVIINESDFITITENATLNHNDLDLKHMFLGNLTDKQLCNAHKYGKELRDNYFTNIDTEMTTLLFNIDHNIIIS